MTTRWWRALAAALAALAAFAVVAVIVNDDGAERRPAAVVTVQQTAPTESMVDTDAAEPGRQNGTVTASAPAVREALEADLHPGARTENPPGVTAADLDAAREQHERLAAADQLPAVTPDAAPEQAGCRTRMVRNYSSRRGVRPRLLVLHYTVSPNRPGWGDVDAVTNLFNTRSFAASSHYIIDREGHCAYIVRESDKAWTQATANPVAISWEIINSGREGTLTSGAGRVRVVATLRAAARRWDIPPRPGAVSGCTVARSGIVDHVALGACGGGHVDVNPYRREIAGIIRDVAPPAVTQTDRVTCRKLNWWRRAGRPHGEPERHAVRRRRALGGRGVTCTSGGPVRR